MIRNNLRVDNFRIAGKLVRLVRLDEWYSLQNENIKNYKLRELNDLISKSKSDKIGLVVSTVSTMPNIAGVLSRIYGKKLTLYYTKKTEDMTDFQLKFPEFEAIYKPGMYSVAKSIAKKEFDGDLLFKNENVIYEDVVDDAKYLKFLHSSNIHIVLGSGFTFNSFLEGFEKYDIKPNKITVYRVGMEVKVGSFLFKINYIDLTKIWKYEDRVNFIFNPNYEAKMLKYCSDTGNFEDGDFFLII